MVLPYLQFVATAVSHIPSPTLTPSYLPSKLTLQQVTEKLGIDFNAYKQEYMWALTENQLKQSAQKPLSSWAATAIEKILDSPALSRFRREASTCTLFDILLADRLDQLDDLGANNKLCVGYEVPMTATVKQEHGGGTISGRADWSLGYMEDTTRLEQMLIVLEAKFSVQVDNMAQKTANSTIKHFDDHLKMTYDIPGEESAAGGSEDDATFDVIEVDGVSILISHRANRGDSSLKSIDC
ncbi:predicted protein [Histoplasma mississippiense (nom. inval.)]|uniref:predicted protein n=1 Tax=Ajellomyces capsulatus (strain NAm1 / WU24) TaxID=2059318 RepID=UPI000157CED8|nr:predicted protein [Histoplasma mississippiense (nom. inval.)]EDN04367.1 predicted protein [Histoplasma mississippiense (nom. inval.)]